jgi:hypothetical protein
MRKYAVVIVVSLGLTVSGFAQRGGSHGNAGAAAGAGASHMAGAGSEAGTSDVARGNSAGTLGSTASSMSKQSPDTALTKSPQLASNLDKLLPTGMTAQQACSGFKNLGQCVAAVHVSKNLNIPFADLKAKMTGTNPEALGKAIQDMKPDANAKQEAKKGQKQAQQDLNQSAS